MLKVNFKPVYKVKLQPVSVRYTFSVKVHADNLSLVEELALPITFPKTLFFLYIYTENIQILYGILVRDWIVLFSLSSLSPLRSYLVV
jgi:hypothetical protein